MDEATIAGWLASLAVGMACILIWGVMAAIKFRKEQARRRKEYKGESDRLWNEYFTGLPKEPLIKGGTMCDPVVNNTINKSPGYAIELDPDKRYCIEVPVQLSDPDIARLNYQWKELMGGKHPLLILGSGAKIARIQEPDDPDHNPDA